MKNADKPNVVIINGNNNKVSFGGKVFLPAAVVILAIAIVVLAVSHCCPELLAELVRWLISTAINS
ncbi:MAG: hypothetical protein BWY46_01259 [Firmicutes bacterium ADurb.Bin300]|nr:MAG: hypothetical protein BWY46_01259 [Firmicutes bacterium ADurb.Bin300]